MSHSQLMQLIGPAGLGGLGRVTLATVPGSPISALLAADTGFPVSPFTVYPCVPILESAYLLDTNWVGREGPRLIPVCMVLWGRAKNDHTGVQQVSGHRRGWSGSDLAQ